MKWYDELYIGRSILHKKKKVIWKIDHNAGQVFTYVITLPANPDNLLDIIPSWELMQKYYPKRDITIVGLAGGYPEALEVVQEIITEVYEHTGELQVPEYLLEKVNHKRKNET